jgi:hypothetical protein
MCPSDINHIEQTIDISRFKSDFETSLTVDRLALRRPPKERIQLPF